jgi:hypothetical protein
VGELIQIDGSEHAWFENRAPHCTLLVYVDDATSLRGMFADVKKQKPGDTKCRPGFAGFLRNTLERAYMFSIIT